LTNLKRGVPTFKEELFGPVASFYKVENEQAAIDLANDSPWPVDQSSQNIKQASG
jgi:succinate-semialdehyde dehydrogenase/glutarate-semialdehyde dehydrogenase